MGKKWFVFTLVTLMLSSPGSAFADIDSNTTYTLDLTNAEEAPKKAKWTDPNRITITPEGLGWGNRDDQGSRDVWLQPFIGYVQFLYEAQLRGGQRMKGLQVEVNWWVSGKHLPPKDESARKGRDGSWSFKSP